MLPLLVLLGTIAGAWYLLIVRPQKDHQTRHQMLVGQLQVGDHVLTVGGIYGRVTALEGTSVVLELAPGLTSRIAADGIARIVHPGEAPLPTAPATPPPAPPTSTSTPDTTDHHMHQHPHQPDHGQPHQLPAPPPPATYAPAPGYHQQQQLHPAHVVAPPAMPQHVAPAAHAPAPPATTLRAQVVDVAPGAGIPTFRPRPWQGIAPVGSQAIPHHAAPQHAPSVPVVQPFATAAPPAHVAVHAQPPLQQYAPPAAQPPTSPYAPAYAQPAVPPAAHTAPPVEPQLPGRSTSRAPEGMGSSLRLDDPSIVDTMRQARQERDSLAEEYRRQTAPLVDTTPHVQHAMPQGAHAATHPLVSGTHAQYPAPVRPPAVEHAGLPRPAVQHDGPIDPVFAEAFQRRTPWAPPASLPAPAPPAQPAAATQLAGHA